MVVPCSACLAGCRQYVPLEYSGEEQSICAVGLVRPRQGVFVEAIQHLLVLCTTTEASACAGRASAWLLPCGSVYQWGGRGECGLGAGFLADSGATDHAVPCLANMGHITQSLACKARAHLPPSKVSSLRPTSGPTWCRQLCEFLLQSSPCKFWGS